LSCNDGNPPEFNAKVVEFPSLAEGDFVVVAKKEDAANQADVI
jgi:hypothetical protein